MCLQLGNIPIALAHPGSSAGGPEIVIDSGAAGFGTTGSWPTSTAVPGQLHDAESALHRLSKVSGLPRRCHWQRLGKTPTCTTNARRALYI
jgi:hypothetical protein